MRTIKPIIHPRAPNNYSVEDICRPCVETARGEDKKLHDNKVDYYNNKNDEGNIKVQFINFFPFDVKIKKGERICQGIFEQYLLIDNDIADGTRVGGHGSTDKN